MENDDSILFTRQTDRTSSLTVTIEPLAARDTCQWRIDSPQVIWHYSGETIANLFPDSDVTIIYQGTATWLAPENETITLADGANSASGTFVSCPESYDINGDGMVTPGDSLMILKHHLGIELITDQCSLRNADANKDDSVTPGDALFVLYVFLGS